MTPSEIYNIISEYIGRHDSVVICDLHSACAPRKGKMFLCQNGGSNVRVIDFDSVKTKADIALGIESRKSVDGIADAPSGSVFCFIEMKSWELLLSNNVTEAKIKKQARKYESDLPRKLADSIEICKQIGQDDSIFDNCRIVFILLTDISVKDDGISSIDTALSALAGSSSNLNLLCNQLSTDIMKNIPQVETRYWECRDFDKRISLL